MKRIILVCNASSGIKEALEKQRSSFLSDADHLSVFRDMSVEIISTKIHAAYITSNPTEDYDTCAVVFAINGREEELNEFRLRMPGVIALGLPFEFGQAHRKQYNRFIGALKRELTHVRKLATALKKEFVERDSRTPLLLPLRNFRSTELNQLMIDVQNFRTGEPDYDVSLRRLINSRGPQSLRESGKTFFENRNSIRFYGPSKGGARHGLPVYNPPHNLTCMVNAFFRLGARYDVRFHYDCQYAAGQIGGIFPNCHDHEENWSKRTHLNVAPNDFTR
jgi:hypothetical protein